MNAGGGERPVLFLDGAMGTELRRAGLPAGEPPERWLAEQPETVKGIHAAYRSAGAAALYTNTFGGNRIRLAKFGLAGATESLNRGAVALARLSGGGALVFGAMGPTGERVEAGACEPADAFEAFAEQAGALMAAGADGLVLETFTAPREAALAVVAAKEAGATFILMTSAWNHEACAVAALAAGATAVGVNCTEPGETAALVARLRAVLPAGTPLAAKPSAGQPQGEPPVWPVAPAAFVTAIRDCLAAGATMVGGCCGTTPAHLEALR